LSGGKVVNIGESKLKATAIITMLINMGLPVTDWSLAWTTSVQKKNDFFNLRHGSRRGLSANY